MKVHEDVGLAVARTSDVDAVVALGHRAWRATFEPLVGPDLVRDGLRSAWARDVIEGEIAHGLVRIIRAQGCVVAMCSARDEASSVFLARLYVEPHHQHRGVGSALLSAVLRDAGTRPTELTVLSTNVNARTFYERHAFHAVGTWPGDDGWPDQLRLRHNGTAPRP